MAWKHSRELLRKQFIQAQYQSGHRFSEHVDNLVSYIPTRGTVDLQPLFFNFTLDTTTALLFGRSVYSLRGNIDQNANNRDFAKYFNIAQEGLAKRFRLAPFHFVYNPAEFRKACTKVHQFVEGYIREWQDASAVDREGKSSWFIDQLSAGSQTQAEIRDQLLNILLAGRDTTACCLSWTLYLVFL